MCQLFPVSVAFVNWIINLPMDENSLLVNVPVGFASEFNKSAEIRAPITGITPLKMDMNSIIKRRAGRASQTSLKI
jgi:hypothetical protein